MRPAIVRTPLAAPLAIHLLAPRLAPPSLAGTRWLAPDAIPSQTPEGNGSILPGTNHVFQPGHFVMVQVQSIWSPLHDRNPQTFVPDILIAKSVTTLKATPRVVQAPDVASLVGPSVVRTP